MPRRPDDDTLARIMADVEAKEQVGAITIIDAAERPLLERRRDALG